MAPVKLTASIANLDSLPDSAIITRPQTVALTTLSKETLARDPEMQAARVRLSTRRYGYNLGKIREVLRRRTGNAAA